MGELVLITGTSSGIGLSAAVECAAAGHTVVATMRSLDRKKALVEAAEARGVKLDLEQLDVNSPNVPSKLRELLLKYGPFYAIVNNAGIAIGGVFEEQSEIDVREQFETNVFGLMAVTRAVLPSMRAARRGRILNVSSISGRVALPLTSVYAATKHAIEGFSEALRWEVEPFGIEVCLIEPGTFKTSIFVDNPRRGSASEESGPPTKPRGHDGAYAEITEVLKKLVLDEADKAPAPDAVGKVIAKLVTEPAPKFRTVIGMDARTLVTLRRMVPDRLFASGIRRLMALPRPR